MSILDKATYISTNTTTQVLTGAGVLKRITIGETAAGAITVHDATGSDSNAIAVLKSSVVEGTYEFGCKVSNGIKVVTAAASKITVIYE